MPRMTGKEALARMLMAEGVEYVFGNPGTSVTPLMDVLQDFPDLKYITALQEASAVGIADGYARSSGKPAIANVHIAGGLANAISMLYNSFRGGTPLVLTAGNSDTRMFLADPVLSGDLVGMTRQYSKWSHEIIHGADVPVAVRRAFKEATTPPTGPVFVSFPWDSLDDEADVDTAAAFLDTTGPGPIRRRCLRLLRSCPRLRTPSWWWETGWHSPTHCLRLSRLPNLRGPRCLLHPLLRLTFRRAIPSSWAL